MGIKCELKYLLRKITVSARTLIEILHTIPVGKNNHRCPKNTHYKRGKKKETDKRVALSNKKFAVLKVGNGTYLFVMRFRKPWLGVKSVNFGFYFKIVKY